MNRGRFRARMLIAIGSGVLLFATSETFFYSARNVIYNPGTDDLIAALRERFLQVGTVFTLLAIVLGLLLARSLVRPMHRMRAMLPDLIRGDTIAAPKSIWQEQHLLYLAISNAITELRTRLQKSETERRELAQLLDAGTEGRIQVNAAGRIVYTNAAAKALLGLPADARGQPIAALVRQAELRDVITRTLHGESHEPRELAIDDRQVAIACAPLEQQGGAVITILDLTEVRRLEAVRRDFVANVSHELKTPLTSIRGYTETLVSDRELPEETRQQFLEVIHRNATRVQGIVDDLLDLSRLQSGGWIPELQDVNAAELAEDAWISCREIAERKQIQFNISSIGSPIVSADPGGLRQVYSNLFDNALRYTSANGRITVHIARIRGGRQVEPTGDRVEIRVQDTGSGIPRDALARIFERFYRVDPARSRAEGGTGLGLSIVKHLIESMSGEVAAESELGRGTTIKLRLPAV